jgi:hypothetical protein
MKFSRVSIYCSIPCFLGSFIGWFETIFIDAQKYDTRNVRQLTRTRSQSLLYSSSIVPSLAESSVPQASPSSSVLIQLSPESISNTTNSTASPLAVRTSYGAKQPSSIDAINMSSASEQKAQRTPLLTLLIRIAFTVPVVGLGIMIWAIVSSSRQSVLTMKTNAKLYVDSVIGFGDDCCVSIPQEIAVVRSQSLGSNSAGIVLELSCSSSLTGDSGTVLNADISSLPSTDVVMTDGCCTGGKFNRLTSILNTSEARVDDFLTSNRYSDHRFPQYHTQSTQFVLME